MWICVNCGRLFEEPFHWQEDHGLDYPPYEEHCGSPCCYDNYIEARECSCCGEYITDRYVKTYDDKRYCENCYIVMDLDEEDD